LDHRFAGTVEGVAGFKGMEDPWMPRERNHGQKNIREHLMLLEKAVVRFWGTKTP
jgi:hypothetical protein